MKDIKRNIKLISAFALFLIVGLNIESISKYLSYFINMNSFHIGIILLIINFGMFIYILIDQTTDYDNRDK